MADDYPSRALISLDCSTVLVRPLSQHIRVVAARRSRPTSHDDRLGMRAIGHDRSMLMDILIALVIVVIAAALGLTVHPLLWFIVILALIWLFARRGSWSR
jgi:hypothetical protein